jgi:hypothetical protein
VDIQRNDDGASQQISTLAENEQTVPIKSATAKDMLWAASTEAVDDQGGFHIRMRKRRMSCTAQNRAPHDDFAVRERRLTRSAIEAIRNDNGRKTLLLVAQLQVMTGGQLPHAVDVPIKYVHQRPDVHMMFNRLAHPVQCGSRVGHGIAEDEHGDGNEKGGLEVFQEAVPDNLCSHAVQDVALKKQLEGEDYSLCT